MKFKNSEAMLVVKQISSQCSFSVPLETIKKPFCISNRGFEPLTFVKKSLILDRLEFPEPPLSKEL